MRVIAIAALILVASTLAAAQQQLVFSDDFEDGVLDGWHEFSTRDNGYDFWFQGGQLWGRASSGGDCSACSGCDGIITVDGLVVDDVMVEVKLTNRNHCGLFCIYLRVTEPTFAQHEDVDLWMVVFDPGTNLVEVVAVHEWSAIPGCRIIDNSFNFGIDVPRYFRVILYGQTMELWHATEAGGDYSHLHTITCPEGSTSGYVGLRVVSSGKIVSFDDFRVYTPAGSPAELGSWSIIKALYR
jgi:hypothetical protein